MNSIVLKSRSVIYIAKQSNKIGAIQIMRQRKVKANKQTCFLLPFFRLKINHAFSTDLRIYVRERARVRVYGCTIYTYRSECIFLNQN